MDVQALVSEARAKIAAATLKSFSVYLADTTVGGRAGADACYMPLSNGYGVKLFRSAYKRDWNYDLQSRLAEHHFAPQLLTKVDGTLSGQESPHHGYITEHAAVCWDLIRAGKYTEADFYRDSAAREREIMQVFPNIIPYDRHEGNWGFLRDTLMAIDVGHFGLDGRWGYAI